MSTLSPKKVEKGDVAAQIQKDYKLNYKQIKQIAENWKCKNEKNPISVGDVADEKLSKNEYILDYIIDKTVQLNTGDSGCTSNF